MSISSTASNILPYCTHNIPLLCFKYSYTRFYSWKWLSVLFFPINVTRTYWCYCPFDPLVVSLFVFHLHTFFSSLLFPSLIFLKIQLVFLLVRSTLISKPLFFSNVCIWGYVCSSDHHFSCFHKVWNVILSSSLISNHLLIFKAIII